ncbi:MULTISPECIES: type 2 periplasmic-binding domain-containing protein [Acidiphilium]|uniref:hypothetical protein n=1 Tax=Acidiphilium TaxID=522 RepID=UPI00049476BC|nr:MULTISPECIES: hypothetical protein [Acidiphilium]
MIDAAFRVAGHHQTTAVEVTQSASAPALLRLGATVALINGFSVATTGMAGWVLRPFVPLAAIIGQTLLPLDRRASRPIEAVTEVLHVTVSDAGRGRVGWTTDDSWSG